MKTLEEAIAAIEEMKADHAAELAAVEAEKTAVLNKNKELVDREKSAKTAADKAKDDALKASGDIAAIEASWQAKMDAAIAEEKELTAAEKKRADDAIKKSNTDRINVDVMKAIKDAKILDDRQELLHENISFKAKVINDKIMITTKDGTSDLATYMAGFVKSEAGKHFVAAPNNSGAAVTTQTNATSNSHGYTKENFDSKMGDWLILSKENPEQAAAIAQSLGRNDLV